MAPDQSDCAHDHPWPFVSLVLWGRLRRGDMAARRLRGRRARSTGVSVVGVPGGHALPPGGGVPAGGDVDAGLEGGALPALGVSDPSGPLGASSEVRSGGGLLTSSSAIGTQAGRSDMGVYGGARSAPWVPVPRRARRSWRSGWCWVSCCSRTWSCWWTWTGRDGDATVGDADGDPARWRNRATRCRRSNDLDRTRASAGDPKSPYQGV